METAIYLIRFGTALTMVLFGIHQLIRPAAWVSYIPAWIGKLSPFSLETDMRLHSLGNIILGVWLALGIAFPLGIWLSLIWWITILPFAFWKDWRIGLRDLSITLSLVALLVLNNL